MLLHLLLSHSVCHPLFNAFFLFSQGVITFLHHYALWQLNDIFYIFENCISYVIFVENILQYVYSNYSLFIYIPYKRKISVYVQHSVALVVVVIAFDKLNVFMHIYSIKFFTIYASLSFTTICFFLFQYKNFDLWFEYIKYLLMYRYKVKFWNWHSQCQYWNLFEGLSGKLNFEGFYV